MPFTTIKREALEYLTAPNLSAPHCFTTRFGGVSTGDTESLNLALGHGDTMENVAQNLRILAKALEFDPERLVMTRQTHSDLVIPVTARDHRGLCHRDYPECDGLVTCDPGTTLLVFTADCTPLLFHDPVTGAVGAAHAGWRGTASAIGQKVVSAMVREYGCKASDIHAAIGPNIAQCHFETDADVPHAMVSAFGRDALPYIKRQGEKYYLDLKGINAMALGQMGVTHIDISTNCTFCECSRFWSHRATAGRRGSQGALILCKEVAKP